MHVYCMYMYVYLFDVGADSDLKPRIATALFCGRRYESMSQQSRVTTSVLYNTTLCAFPMHWITVLYYKYIA